MTSVLVQALELIAGFEAEKTPSAVGLSLRNALQPFGARGFYAGSFPRSQTLPTGRMVEAGRRYAQFSPPGWLDAYARQGLDRGNPVIFAPARRHSAFRWSAPGFPDLENWRGLDLARELGFADGLAVPCHEPGGRVGVVSMAFERFDLAPREIRAITLAALMAHDRMAALAGPLTVPPKLTRRERDCLCFVADGLSDAEIADRLGISQATAHAHVENAKRKLGARTRAQAVARLCCNMLL
ncbi:LuxR family transcriptional regulator [Bosea sp. BK604]|uniref:helix-turn-helix transcriptional regulator n=1 Tax=Bosea sp. BK604 TaxID=2512180 RepID=UPI001045D300|nr:LuxR family transcriptional regulator [Bosea sp. BK604]